MTGFPEPAEYCRAIEQYLCRKNDGHLIRIVGPAFEQVCGWATRGVPLKVACAGIDRYFERYYAKGPRRRPVRVEFCEADVLDVFDEWRRAVGLPVAATGLRGRRHGGHEGDGHEGHEGHEGDSHEWHEGHEGKGHEGHEGEGDEGHHACQRSGDHAPAGHEGARHEEDDDPGRGRRGSLAAHLERVVARLTALHADTDRALGELVEATARELVTVRADSRRLRGQARQALIGRLHDMDRALLEAARARLGTETMRRFAAEAEAELAPFRGRLAADAYERSRTAAVDRLVREHVRLPTVIYD